MPDETQLPMQVEPSLDDVLARYISAEERGTPLDGEELIALHPRFAAELREFFANREQMQRLAEPLRVTADAVRASDHPLKKIRYFGDYELLEEIAVGGMGIVYKARQVSLNRVVAVKMILKGTLASDDDVKRFLAEAEAAANLQHPAIVAIHEVGLHEGQHYFSMDFVEGQSLAQLPREQPLSARQSAEYMRDAAEAVHYAHEQGILHRDLKPSNILIDRQGRVRITDFGLAKKITGNSDLTLTGQILGTPSYMPPEQASGKRSLVAAASDVYSLGAVLYELLAGRPPFRGETPSETLRQVETLDPISPRLLNPAVPRDLDTVCLKCLEKEPHKRYGTAQLLADDLGRYLRGEGVTARRPSAVYRFAKFTRRNRTGLTVTTLIVTFIVLLGGVVGWMVRDREAQRGEYEKQIANDRAARLTKTAEDIQLALQEAQTLGERAVALIDDSPYQWEATLAAALSACKRAELATHRDKEPIDSSTMDRVSALRAKLDADEQDRQFVARVDAIRMEASQVDLEKSQFKLTGQSLEIETLFGSRGIKFGSMTPGQVVDWIQARPKPVQQHLLAALDIWLGGTTASDDKQPWLTAVLQAADHNPWRTEVRRAMLAREGKVLESLVHDVRPDEHPVAFLLLVAKRLPPSSETTRFTLLRQIQSAYPDDFWANEDLGLALRLAVPPRWSEAIPFYTAAVALRPENPGALLNLGQSLANSGDQKSAVTAYRRALEFAPNYAAAHMNLGIALRSMGDFNGAITALRRAIELDTKSANAHSSLGLALSANGELDAAIAAFREAIRLDPADARFRTNLGFAFRTKGDPDSALAEFQEALRLDPKYPWAHNNIGLALRDKGDLDGAIAEYCESIQLHPNINNTHNNLGLALEAKGDLDAAILEYREEIRLNASYALPHNNLGYVLQRQGDLGEAMAEFREAIRLDAKLAKPHNNLGVALKDKGNLDGAIAEYREAVRLDPKYAKAHTNLGNALRKKGDRDEAIAAFRKALEAAPGFAEAQTNLQSVLAERTSIKSPQKEQQPDE